MLEASNEEIYEFACEIISAYKHDRHKRVAQAMGDCKAIEVLGICCSIIRYVIKDCDSSEASFIISSLMTAVANCDMVKLDS